MIPLTRDIEIWTVPAVLFRRAMRARPMARDASGSRSRVWPGNNQYRYDNRV